jgi:hypothetical protein
LIHPWQEVVMNEKSLSTLGTGESELEGPPAPGAILILLVAVLMVALAAVIQIARLGGAETALTRPIVPPVTEGEYGYYTERYWQMAADRQAAQPATSAAPGAPVTSEYGTYTDRYWQMAADREANLQATSAAPGAPATSEYGTYTDRYWQMAADREARLHGASRN